MVSGGNVTVGRGQAIEENSESSMNGTGKWVTTGGAGGTMERGGYAGNSNVHDWVQGGGGRQGEVTSPREGEISLPIVLGSTG